MHTCYKLRAGTVRVVVLQEELPCFLVEGTFGIGINEEAFDCHENVTDAIRRLPVLLQRVHTNLSRRRDVRVENLGCEPAFWGCSGEFVCKLEPHPEVPACVWSLLWPLNNPCEVKHILLTRDNANTLRRVVLQLGNLAH